MTARALLVPSLLLALAVASVPARAQAPELHAIREALAGYDLDGDRTIGALRDLHRLQGELGGAAQTEARFLRAVVATDLVLAGAIDPQHARLRERVCAAIAVDACDAVAAHLSAELTALARGPYRRPAQESLAALTADAALARGELAAARRGSGVRRDLLLLAAAAREGGLAAIASDPCASRCDAPWPSIDPASRRELDALREVSAAMQRVERAASGGDALAQAVLAAVRPIASRAESTVVAAAPTIPEALGVDAAAASGDPVRADLVVIVGATEVRVARAGRWSVRAGQLAAVGGGDDVLPGSAAVALPSELRPVITAIDEVVAALAARAGETIAIAPTADAPAHVVARVLVSAQRAERAPDLVVRRAPDGTLRAIAIALVDRDEVGAAGDLIVRVRMGGYGVARGRGREQSVPRVRGADGALGFDLDGLATMLERIPHRRTVLDPMPSLSAHDLLDAAFRVARPDAPVALAL